MRKNIYTILTLVLIIATAALSLANRQSVTVSYIFGEFRLPLILLILTSVLIGFIINLLLGISRGMTHRHQVKTLSKEKAELVKQVDRLTEELKTTPVPVVSESEKTT